MEIDIEKENKEILNAYRGLLRSVKVDRSKEDTKFIRKAFDVAVDAHKDMRRKSGEPYIFHPIAVARICAEEIGLGPKAIACALLHDTVEDTDITLDDVENMFGEQCRKIINGLTKISGVFDLHTSQQAENFKKMILTLPEDIRVILIKLADRLHNMRTLDSMRKDKQLKIASETHFLYAPLAHRLGLYAIKTELEDLSLKYTEPIAYQDINTKLTKTKDIRARFIRKFSSPIKRALDDVNFVVEIKGREKSIFSIWNKMQKKAINFEEVYDIFAIRVIIDTPEGTEKADCWKAYSIVTDNYKPNPERLRDWISHPKQNGYESLHTTVMSPTGKWVEVQIRTKRMDEIAEKGLAAHWKYKSANEKDGMLDNWIDKIRVLLENRDADALEFIDDFKLALFAEEIFIFTPNGDLRRLPAKATALDFAFEIHSQVGVKCIGAKVNHKLVPLSYELKSGDQVEIITSEKQSPKEDWLNYVVTSKAKSKIKSSLKEERKEASMGGREILERKLKSLKVVFDESNLNELINFYDFKEHTEMYFQIANGKLDLSRIKEIIVKGGRLKNGSITESIKGGFSSLVRKFKKKTEELIIGEDDKFDYKFAPCCNPIPGDDVFGFITINDGIKIHRNKCPNASQLMANYAYRTIRVRWRGQEYDEFLTGMVFTGIDDIGVVNNITGIISADLNVNMKSISFDSNDGIFEGRVMAYVRDTEHLDNLMNQLIDVEGIKTIERIDSEE
ncbi:MAG: guanosine-3',5'-bis(diphosphate) 3'-pyrophosphohydrolase [Parvicellaceae bacterium]